MIAGVAIWGYLTIKDEARRIAREGAQNAVAEHLSSQQVKEELKAEIKRLYADEIRRVEEGINMPSAYAAVESKDNSAEKTGSGKTVGKRYPGKRHDRGSQRVMKTEAMRIS